jgi:hypothetical protein
MARPFASKGGGWSAPGFDLDSNNQSGAAVVTAYAAFSTNST